MQITTATVPRKTVIHRLQSSVLSPSLHLNLTERVELYQQLLADSNIVDDLTALEHIFQNTYKSTENEKKIIVNSSFEIVNEMLHIYKSITVDLAYKEASGRSLLGLIISELVCTLKKQDSRFFLKLDHEYRIIATGKSGPDYAANVAAIFIDKVSTAFISLLLSFCLFFPQKGKRIPIVLYEYKPQVPLSYKDIYSYYICEMMIQAYYCVKTFRHVIHCLTDMSEWHYLKIEYNQVQDSLNIIWTHSFMAENISEAHVKFLCTAIEPMFEKIAVENAQATSTS